MSLWLSHCLSSLLRSEGSRVRWTRLDRLLCSPSPSLSSLYSLTKRRWQHHCSHESPLCSPRPLRPGVATEWPGCQKRRKTKYGSISVTSPHLLGYKGRINSFSLTCLPPSEQVGLAVGTSECSSRDDVGGWYLSLLHSHTSIYMLALPPSVSLSSGLTSFYWHVMSNPDIVYFNGCNQCLCIAATVGSQILECMCINLKGFQ